MGEPRLRAENTAVGGGASGTGKHGGSCQGITGELEKENQTNPSGEIFFRLGDLYSRFLSFSTIKIEK